MGYVWWGVHEGIDLFMGVGKEIVCLRNIIGHNVLIESTDVQLGHEYAFPGVYTSPLMKTAKQCPYSVSYTHLTLPTIYSV